jgi:molecular chaperone HtpG
MTTETLNFQAETAKLLHIVANALYSEKEIFLRELISNASDACDKLRYAALTEADLMGDDAELQVTLTVDKDAKTLTIADNGIGMNRDELIENLGTIARSGTSAFMEQLTGEDDKDVALIGQFGVGFYSGFVVSKLVDVTSRHAGEEHSWTWSSDGLGEFTITEADQATRGTTITLHLKDEEGEFLEAHRLRSVVKRYSDHIAIPVVLTAIAADPVEDAGEEDAAEEPQDEKLNEASALWARNKSDIKSEQYTEFYHHVAHAFDEPWSTIHVRAEGKIEYTMLLFIPGTPPFDLFHPDRASKLKLYVKRVFITDDCENLIPSYLRFLRGVVDCEDLPLNVSRELLQNSPVLNHIKSALTKRVLSDLEKKAKKKPEEYAVFWKNFGAVMKEGIYEDYEQRERLMKLARFRSTTQGDALVSLEDYVSRMKDKQTEIYYVTGEDIDLVRQSPQLEGYAARGIEVLLMTDAVDDFWVRSVTDFDGKPMKSVTQGGTALDDIAPEEDAKDKPEAAPEGDTSALIVLLKQELGEAVKDVRTTDRLAESPVCLVADDSDMDIHLAKLLKAQGQDMGPTTRILELNPRHDLIKSLAKSAGEAGATDRLADAAHLLLDQARILEGDPVPDPAAFARRLSQAMSAKFS